MSPDDLLKVQTWFSPAFPVGGFSYSQGIEWAVEAGDIVDRADLQDWIALLLEGGSLRNDALLLAAAMRSEAGALDELAELALALAGSAERRLETSMQGRAFIKAIRAVWDRPGLGGLPDELAYPVAVGAVARAHGLDPGTALTAYLHAATANLVSAGVRLIPLGQTDGLRVLQAFEAPILTAAKRALAGTLDDLGSMALRAEIAAMRHETQTTRLFRS